MKMISAIAARIPVGVHDLLKAWIQSITSRAMSRSKYNEST